MNKKIGAAIITYNRPEFFERCVNSIPNIDTLIVVNDGTPYSNELYPKSVKEVIQHTQSKHVGMSKNDAMRYLVQDGCEYIFLIEDDMLITNPLVFEKYIKTAAKSGLWRLSFGYHGPANKNEFKQPKPREIIDYGDGIEVAFNFHSVGSFCLFHKNIIKNVGYHDEAFKGAWEHIELDVRAIKAGLMPAYWWWPDVADSYNYINELACSEVSSVIRKTPEWTKNMQLGAAWFKHKHGYMPTTMPDTPKEEVLKKLEFLQENYSRDFSLL